MNSELLAGIRKVSEEDVDYPKSLLDVDDRPAVLYIKGRWPLPEGCRIGIVGTRRASPYGAEVARRFTLELVDRGVVTVSGLAAGIDTCAHRATLDAGGWTVAVLGHGFGFQYPKENAALFEDIAKRGTLVSEFSFDTRPQSAHFPRRNRIISGLSQGVLVVEAGARSGASITARYAAEQGRDVFVIPGSIFSPQSQGCHRLIKEGARLVETASDILEEYGLISVIPEVDKGCHPYENGGPSMDSRFRGNDNDERNDNRGGKDESLNPAEKELFGRLSNVPISVDELAELSVLPIDRLAEVLLSLELKGRIKALPGQYYVTYN